MENELNEGRKSDKWEKSTIRNLVTGAIIIIIIITGFVILINKDSQINELHIQTQKLDSEIVRRDSVIEILDGAISEIEQNITFIKNKREQLEFDYREGNRNQKERIIEDIALMNAMLEESEKKMDELNKQLEASNLELSSFRNRVAKLSNELKEQNLVVENLSKELKKRDYQIAEMNQKVTQLENVVLVQTDSLTALSDSIGRSTKMIQTMDRQLHKAYWTLGTFKELKENEILAKEGGFLGIVGKNKILRKNFNEEYFTELDIRETDIIPLHAKKAEVISEHSRDSYRFVYQDDQVAYLKIENPNEFWKLTRYAVIEVKQ
jgi:hypothetical protein